MNDFAQLPLYCNSLVSYSRWETREVQVGDVALGADNPIRVQSMTNTPTLDIAATAQQCIRLINNGCDYIRITTPTVKEAEALTAIKKELMSKGYKVPLIADIHFSPEVAEAAARLVEKIRINPGNYVDKKKFAKFNYTDSDYAAEIERIRERINPLINVCKEYGTAMRIGVNHGSLSDRIMSRFGDSPEGMVESALEFVRICSDFDYHNLVLSMKSSNPQIMVQAYRLLVSKMKMEGYNYPLHLGVTEAGDSEDGRIKSAVGIGTLLEDGLGDTIRVSLTESPEFEIPVAKTIVNRYNNRLPHDPITEVNIFPINPYAYTRRKTTAVEGIGGSNPPVVLIDTSNKNTIIEKDLENLGFLKTETEVIKNDQAFDFVYMGSRRLKWDEHRPGIIYNFKQWQEEPNTFPLYKADEYLKNPLSNCKINFVLCELKHLSKELIESLKKETSVVLILRTNNKHGVAEQRRAFIKLIEESCETPVIIMHSYDSPQVDTYLLDCSTDAGALLIDGLGDGIWMNLKTRIQGKTEEVRNISFGILQATRTRITKTEYISCPGCGRTLFNLEETASRIKERTNHLKNLKIGIMGCIVNGPGEMADADYGYVGAGNGKITLYKSHEVMKKNIPEEEAVDALVSLIKEHGDWI